MSCVLMKCVKKRGYPKQLVDKYKSESAATERADLLRPRTHRGAKKRGLHKYWSIVKQGCPEDFKPPLMSYKRDRMCAIPLYDRTLDQYKRIMSKWVIICAAIVPPLCRYCAAIVPPLCLL